MNTETADRTPANINAASWDSEVIAASRDRPILVEFGADWCGPCRMMARPLDEIARERRAVATVAKVDVDADSALASAFSVRSIPTFLVFRDGVVVERFVGLQGKPTLLAALDRHAPAANHQSDAHRE